MMAITYALKPWEIPVVGTTTSSLKKKYTRFLTLLKFGRGRKGSGILPEEVYMTLLNSVDFTFNKELDGCTLTFL